MKQKQKDRFSLRLRVIGGHLTAENLRSISKVADEFGSGIVHLTSRQSMEIPFVSLGDVDPVLKRLAEHGLETGICGPKVRTITACQGAAICENGCIDTLSLAREISARYYGRALPHKFKFGITGCLNNCLKADENDLGIKGGYINDWIKETCRDCGLCQKNCRRGAVKADQGEITIDRLLCNNCGRCVKSCPTGSMSGRSGYMLVFGGQFGNKVAPGRQLIKILPDVESLFKISDAALDFYSANGQPGERFGNVIERIGWEKFSQALGGEPLPSAA
ncbi:MAG: 4Fe-4S binding protein [Deltaproteobacteria bacterium]|nr:4Fe-4S binding protein [Deltaproteobacteria bacterium]